MSGAGGGPCSPGGGIGGKVHPLLLRVVIQHLVLPPTFIVRQNPPRVLVPVACKHRHTTNVTLPRSNAEVHFYTSCHPRCAANWSRTPHCAAHLAHTASVHETAGIGARALAETTMAGTDRGGVPAKNTSTRPPIAAVAAGARQGGGGSTASSGRFRAPAAAMAFCEEA